MTARGDCTGWRSLEDGSFVGPSGATVRMDASRRGHEVKYPWIACWPEGDTLVNPHDKIRRFLTAAAACSAMSRALAGEAEFRRVHGVQPDRKSR